MVFPLPYLGPVTVLLVAAAIWDIRHRRIPNALSLVVALTGIGAQALVKGGGAVLAGTCAGVALIALLWQPWLKGRIGGGDVKVAGAAATWMGIEHLPMYLLVTAAVGGLVAAICYLLSTRSVRHEMQNNLTTAATTMAVPDAPIRGGAGRVSVPYGVAVATGALVVLWMGER